MNTNETEKVLDEYREKFGKLPMIPMMQCAGYSDPQYIAMLKKAIERGSKVEEADYDEFFPLDADVLY